MKNLIFLLLLLPFAACSNKGDLDVKSGSYRTFSPVSINGELINDTWVIEGDNFKIIRGIETIYSVSGIRNGNRIELFPDGTNPYYNEDFRDDKIVTTSWGFYFYPSSQKTFTLQHN